MRSKTSMWYEVKYRYEKTLDNGAQKKVTEQYVVEAISFGEAEAVIVSEMAAYVSAGETDVRAVAIAPYNEVLFTENDNDTRYYGVKVVFTTLADDGKEKRSNHNYLVQAASIADARRYILEYLPRMVDHEVVAIVETPIMAVVERDAPEKTTF